MAQLRFVNPSDSFDSLKRGYSFASAVKDASEVIFIAGHGPLDNDMKLVGEDDFEEQVRQTFRNLEHTLKQTGITFDDVLKMNVYLLDIENQQWPFRNVRAEFINRENAPVSTMVQVSRLAIPGMQVEVELIAAR